MQTLQRELKKTFLEGEVCDRIWVWWGRDERGDSRLRALKKIGVDLEAGESCMLGSKSELHDRLKLILLQRLCRKRGA
jgi:hypothetical protein